MLRRGVVNLRSVNGGIEGSFGGARRAATTLSHEHTNRLAKEQSPHLLQHARNPANRSFVIETIKENSQYDAIEADGNDDQFPLGDVADDVDDVDEEMEEVLVAMTSSLTDKLPVASNSVCVGIDPDLSGAIAVRKSRDNCTIAEVIDVPCVTVPVNKKMRRRHDYQSIAAIVNHLQAPQGSNTKINTCGALFNLSCLKTSLEYDGDCSYIGPLAGGIAYVKQAMPFPKFGKQGWYITGYGYEVW